MDERSSGGVRRRRKVRRLAANWAELHRQEDEAERSSPVAPLLGRLAFGVVVLPALAALWHLAWGERPGDLEWAALAIVGGAVLLWNADEWRAELRARWSRRRRDRRNA